MRKRQAREKEVLSQKSNTLMSVKDFFGKSMKSTEEDLEEDKKEMEIDDMKKKMEEGNRKHKEKVELESQKKSTDRREVEAKASKTIEDLTNPKSILKSSTKVPDQMQDQSPQVHSKSVKFDAQSKEKEAPKKAKKPEETVEEEQPKRTSLFKQRMLGRE